MVHGNNRENALRYGDTPRRRAWRGFSLTLLQRVGERGGVFLLQICRFGRTFLSPAGRRVTLVTATAAQTVQDGRAAGVEAAAGQADAGQTGEDQQQRQHARHQPDVPVKVALANQR